jgi:hypothetical protein
MGGRKEEITREYTRKKPNKILKQTVISRNCNQTKNRTVNTPGKWRKAKQREQ